MKVVPIDPPARPRWLRIALALLARAGGALFPKAGQSGKELTLAYAYHMAWVRLEVAKQEHEKVLNDPVSRKRVLAIQERMLSGYSRVQGRLLKPHELRPSKRVVRRVVGKEWFR